MRTAAGFDGGKQLDSRMRHVVVDTLGRLLGVMVTAADAHTPLHHVTDARYLPALVWADDSSPT
ncbi:hypothetical protein [Streptomyces shenzhenensis]|uniref:hypothetical protein n=1 Tax=Streptomyces shenzhenensis TaxID=943815 RepID=UPI003689DAF2